MAGPTWPLVPFMVPLQIPLLPVSPVEDPGYIEASLNRPQAWKIPQDSQDLHVIPYESATYLCDFQLFQVLFKMNIFLKF